MSQKGLGAERELINWLCDRGYDAHVTRASRGPFDVVAYRKRWGGITKERWLIQVKATNEKAFSINREKARDLLSRANRMGANCALAIRFGRPKRWRAYEFELDRKKTTRTFRVRLEDGDKLEDVFRAPRAF